MLMVVMQSDPCSPLKSKNTTFPPIPKRGRVKAQIFESFAKAVVAVASKAGGTLKRNGEGDGGDSGCPSPATPPSSPLKSYPF
ncbi:hypothetical protein JCGZ_05605 [Jatropha curcas]|uniref:Uncharacterized protein n=1 Tax=Jatropha curcas TaxID=180498 RepID=A0A067LA89_JATCU|nr:hypothetical protein JCGZ_05605 [Jatropha curcas]